MAIHLPLGLTFIMPNISISSIDTIDWTQYTTHETEFLEEAETDIIWNFLITLKHLRLCRRVTTEMVGDHIAYNETGVVAFKIKVWT